MSDFSDATLLVRFQAGDEQALSALLGRYEGPLFQFLVGMLRDHHRAEDALQETFVRALERLDGVDPANLRGWLFTVAYHQAMLAKRRQKVRAAGSLDASGPVPDRQPNPLQCALQQDEASRRSKIATSAADRRPQA